MSTVLVVEDDTPLRTALRVGLRARNLDVVDVATGEAAIESVDRRVPDLVLLDLNLPGVDGFAVLTHVRRLSQVPRGVIARTDSTRSSTWVSLVAKWPPARVAIQPPRVAYSNDCG